MAVWCAAISGTKEDGVLECWSDGGMKKMKSKLLKIFRQYSNTPVLHYSNHLSLQYSIVFQRIFS